MLIYERKKKTPIRVILNQKEEKEKIEKTKKENNNDLIIINKENRSLINKKYDLSRINNTEIKEEDLYKKIFYDEEKEEYYKYIPFYNIPRYAPRKVYNEIMKENDTKPDSTESDENKFQINQQKYGQILSNIIKESKFDINDKYYDDKMKETAIVSLLDELLVSISSLDVYVGDEGNDEFNKAIFYIFNDMIKPIVKKETNDELLKTIFDMICSNIFLKFIFTSKYPDSHNYLDKVTNKTNAKLIMEILFEFIKIFIDMNKAFRNVNFYNSLSEIIKQSNTGRLNGMENDNDNYEYTVIFAYNLLDNLLHLNDKILEYFAERKIITILARKLPVENEEIKKIIYKDLKYLIKSSYEYTKELFDLEENEKEGRNIIISKDEIQVFLNEPKVLKCLISEEIEIFILLVVIATRNNILFLRDFFYIGITQLYEYLLYEKKIEKSENIINNIIKILYSLSIVNDKFVLYRLEYIMGHPNPIIIDIPRYKDDTESQNQKWPIFGEKLINGNIDKQIYEYVNINHRNKNLCLLRLLLPNENDKNNDIKIPKEIVKKYISKLIDNCLGEKNNYSLFKYLYLNPGRSLRYENLYQEMKHILMDNDKEYIFEKYIEKEKKFIEQIEKEVEISIKELKDEGTKENEEEDENEGSIPPPPDAEIYFNCEDENMKKFIGFNCNIIPGDIVREEIVQIASGENLAMFRLEYYTKYYETKKLREKLLNSEKNNKNDNLINQNEIKTNNKEDENNSNEINNNIDKDNNEEKKENINKDNDKIAKKEEKEEKKEEEKQIEEKSENKSTTIDKSHQIENSTEINRPKDEENNSKENKDQSKEEKRENLEEKKQNIEEKQPEDNKEKDSKNIEITKEQKIKEEKNQEENKEIKEDENSSEQEKEINIPIETDIDDSLEEKEKSRGITVKKYDISSVSEDKIIYNILSKKDSSIILEDKNIKDKNKVKRVLFRYIFTNKFEKKKDFRAVTSAKAILTDLQKNNCCLIPNFTFDTVKSENIVNFYNVMRIRGELPFMERDNTTVSVDITSDLNFDTN